MLLVYWCKSNNTKIGPILALVLLHTVLLSGNFNSVKSRMATGYNPDGSEDDQLLNLGWAAPSGQMYSTMNDLIKVCKVCSAGAYI